MRAASWLVGDALKMKEMIVDSVVLRRAVGLKVDLKMMQSIIIL